MLVVWRIVWNALAIWKSGATGFTVFGTVEFTALTLDSGFCCGNYRLTVDSAVVTIIYGAFLHLSTGSWIQYRSQGYFRVFGTVTFLLSSNCNGVRVSHTLVHPFTTISKWLHCRRKARLHPECPRRFTASMNQHCLVLDMKGLSSLLALLFVTTLELIKCVCKDFNVQVS